MREQRLRVLVPNIVERRGNTREQVADYVSEALEIFDTFDIPTDLRVEAFKGILQLVAAKTLTQEPTPQEMLLLGRG
jgi:hypothetical protein